MLTPYSVPVSASSIPAALEVTVASLANPAAELALIGTAVPQWAVCRTVAAGTDDATWYRLDATSGATNVPYVVASLTAGLKWVAIAGAYVNQEMTINGGVNLPAETASRVVTTDANKDLDTPATVTTGQAWAFTSTLTVVDGNFTITGSSDATKTIKFEVDAQTTGDDLTINSGAQTDDRTATFPVLTGNSILALSNATLTATRIPFATTNGILTDSASLTWDGTSLTANGVAIADTSGYGVVSLNGTVSPLASTVGMYGAGAGDDNLYLNAAAGAAVQLRVNNVLSLAASDAEVAASVRINAIAATTATSSIRLPHGTAPSAPVDGDMWTTTAGLFVRINGVSVGPLS